MQSNLVPHCENVLKKPQLLSIPFLFLSCHRSSPVPQALFLHWTSQITKSPKHWEPWHLESQSCKIERTSASCVATGTRLCSAVAAKGNTSTVITTKNTASVPTILNGSMGKLNRLAHHVRDTSIYSILKDYICNDQRYITTFRRRPAWDRHRYPRHRRYYRS